MRENSLPKTQHSLLMLLVVVISILLALTVLGTLRRSIEAQQITGGYVSFRNNSCNLETSSLTLNAQQLADFDKGLGVDLGTQTAYKKSGSVPLYMCCLEQTGLKGKDVGNCASLSPIPPNPGSQNPWMTTTGGSLYIKFGRPNSGDPKTGYFLENQSKNDLAQYTYGTGVAQTAQTANSSFENFTIFDYRSAGLNPSTFSGYDGWYGYLKKLAQVNVGLSNIVVPATLAGNLGTVFPANAQIPVYASTGNVAVSSGTVCNTKALIFVEGNLTITPSFRILNKALTLDGSDAIGQGCLFIVKGNATIVAGGTAVSTGDAGLATNFDILEAAIIADGRLSAPVDAAEPLKVIGFMSGRLAHIERDSGNEDIPSLWVEYDPRYMQLFKDELKINRFSTREKGYTTTII